MQGYLNIFGSANSNATVSLWTPDGYWGQTTRHGDWYRGELGLNNSTGLIWLTITNLAVLNTSTNDILTNVVGNMFVPKSIETFTYDLDGNLTSDGRWTNRWDAENRLLSMESLTNDPSASKLRLTFNYDPQSRRITKKVEAWSGSAWSVSYSNRFLYDGWNLVSELVSSNTTARTYTWGLDLSGSGQGAGGIGGLLEINDSTQGREFVAFDGNGNLCALVSATNGNVTAQYEYNPFGQITRSSGSAADANPVRFSTKYDDSETAMLYYGYRSYNPSSGRWLSRDPLEDQKGRTAKRGPTGSPTRFTDNSPPNTVDRLGLSTLTLTIAYDDSVIDRSGLNRELTSMLLRLATYLNICSCGRNEVAISTKFDTQSYIKPTLGYYEYNFPFEGPLGDSVPVLFTKPPLGPLPALGYSQGDKGSIIIEMHGANIFPDVLSHELGHVAGYIGDFDRFHSKEFNNLMYYRELGQWKMPDKQWCDRVKGLAK